ncbi:MAG TPA: TMEM165/GDT1 family protein [Jiangellales bacterium]|nr:TMEM165/GDT1 family protein [Jiangellales bacterium]
MDLAVAATAFALIFPAELPDKTFVATLVLATRYPGRWVWTGVAAAFAVQTTIAVTAGGLLSLLPERAVLVFTATLFTVGAAVLFRSAGHADEDVVEEEREIAGRATRTATGPRASAISFGVLFAAEWGDLSQILTAGLAARYADPVSVFVGAWTALACVAAIGVVAGRTLLRRVHPGLVKRIAGSLFALLALLTWLAAAGLETPL